jgi:hypothetical protein
MNTGKKTNQQTEEDKCPGKATGDNEKTKSVTVQHIGQLEAN